ncbi:AraC family transcriptional regulator [Aquimarina algiphila]|uniref:AraC family transcriptional regulator n=1 Tax=Aquimarina algiphila TaxID=2047982 RepID=UPI002330D29E|nr:AraC family transcriptional regulator [Aquimarina algiphila]
MQLRFYTITLLLLLSFVGFGQSFKVPDSLVDVSYEQLNESYLKIYNDTLKSNIYLNTILTKAIKDNNRERQARSYCYLSYYAKNDSKKLALLSKSIEISQNLSDVSYLLLPYSFKGSYYYNKGDYSLALNNYLKTLEVAKEVNSINYIYITQHNIALIKTHLGKYEEALSIFKEGFLYEKNKKDFDLEYYLESLLSLADSYRYNKILDSATFYNKEGIIKSKNEYKKMYSSFVINEGINQYYKKNFAAAKDSIDKGLSLKNIYNPLNAETITLGMFYSGKIQNKLGHHEKALYYFLKQDSLIQKKKIFISEIRQGYEFIINNYKEKKDKNKQLEFINKLLLFDSITNKQRNFVTDKLFTEFDTPKLIAEKEKLIAILQKENTKISSQNIIISIFLAISLFGGGYYYYRQRLYKKRFLKLLDKTNTINQKKGRSDNDDRSSSSSINKETLNNLMDKLQVFEEKQGYLKQGLNAKDLAKSFGSNASYLSKVVNTFKEKNFTSYINDLRIDFVVNKLKEDRIFRKYTVKAIAQEIGFNNAEAFAKAFYKKTGIYPSYFIKELEKR